MGGDSPANIGMTEPKREGLECRYGAPMSVMNSCSQTPALIAMVGWQVRITSENRIKTKDQCKC